MVKRNNKLRGNTVCYMGVEEGRVKLIGGCRNENATMDVRS